MTETEALELYAGYAYVDTIRLLGETLGLERARRAWCLWMAAPATTFESFTDLFEVTS